MEEYDLEQKRDALYRAEQDLESIISSAEDFFDSPSDKEAVLQNIRENPEAIIASFAKPFMKKIARAMLVVASLTEEVDEASDAVEDQHLTPAEVKVQISKALEDQRIFLERMMEERMETERARYEKMLLEQKTLFEHKLVYSEGKFASLSSKMDCLFESQLRAEREQKAFVESQLKVERERSDKILADHKKTIDNLVFFSRFVSAAPGVGGKVIEYFVKELWSSDESPESYKKFCM